MDLYPPEFDVVASVPLQVRYDPALASEAREFVRYLEQVDVALRTHLELRTLAPLLEGCRLTLVPATGSDAIRGSVDESLGPGQSRCEIFMSFVSHAHGWVRDVPAERQSLVLELSRIVLRRLGTSSPFRNGDGISRSWTRGFAEYLSLRFGTDRGERALAELRDAPDEQALTLRQEGASASGRFVDVRRHVRNHSRFFEPSDGVRGMTVRVDFLHQQFGAPALTRVFRRTEPTVREALLAELQVSEVELEDRWQRWMTSR